MFSHIFKRLRHGRLATLGAFLFAVVMSLSLCGLHAASEAEVKKYEEAYRTIPVTMTVTSLTGVRTDGLDAPKWVINALADNSMRFLIKDVQVKMTMSECTINPFVNGEAVAFDKVVGLSASDMDRDVKKKKDAIVWLDGYGEDTLLGEEVCLIIPEGFMNADGSAPEVKISFTYDNTFDYFPPCTVEREFKIAGSHSLSHNGVFMPYKALSELYKELGAPVYADSVRATVLNNDLLDKVRIQMSKWFVEPSLTTERVPWNYSFYFYYPYALDIDDTQLIHAGEVMQNNIVINEISTTLVFILSAGAGFLVGFLIIHRRKKEIMLMRTMGTPDGAIFRDFAIEQMICAILGAAIGGSFFLWQPLWRIGLFIGIYFVGLSISLIVFLRKNLLKTIKED